VLLLDEPTAGLDAAAEAQLLASVREEARDGRLVLMRPPVLSLTIAVVAVQAFALARSFLRYLERMVSHDAALRLLAAMVSSTNPAFSLTVRNTASAPYSLKAMTITVVIFLPLVLAYQVWSYYVFRRRVTREQFMPDQ
jgi:ABC-type transport system involved in cytochrome bd biosynthesis fused ATPase/permease subunit